MNSFDDRFSVLQATVPLEQYEKLRRERQNTSGQEAFRQIATIVSEIGPEIRFITVEYAFEETSHPEVQSGFGLKKSEINKLVYKYIGVSGGYLGDFSYQGHFEFYVELDLDINPYEYKGTTKERFIKILKTSSADVQSRILEGVLKHFPVGSSSLRTSEKADEIRVWINRLRSGPQVEQPTLGITNEVVERALLDAQVLIKSSGATSGVDRIHTALHGYLQEVCRSAGLTTAEDSAITDLFKRIREAHPAFCDHSPRSEDVIRVQRALATILDSFNPLRNKASVAHPNPQLLPEPEAMLVINTARTILRYIDERVRHFRQNE